MWLHANMPVMHFVYLGMLNQPTYQKALSVGQLALEEELHKTYCIVATTKLVIPHQLSNTPDHYSLALIVHNHVGGSPRLLVLKG